MRPLLTVVVPPPAPIADPTEATAGSCSTASITACWRSAMAGIGDVLRRLGQADDQSGVLLGKEALGDHDVEIAGQRDRAEHHHQRDEAMPQHDLEAGLVEVEQAVEAAFEQPIEPSVLLAVAA